MWHNLWGYQPSRSSKAIDQRVIINFGAMICHDAVLRQNSVCLGSLLSMRKSAYIATNTFSRQNSFVMFGVFAINKILRYWWSPLAGSRALCHPEFQTINVLQCQPQLIVVPTLLSSLGQSLGACPGNTVGCVWKNCHLRSKVLKLDTSCVID